MLIKTLNEGEEFGSHLSKNKIVIIANNETECAVFRELDKSVCKTINMNKEFNEITHDPEKFLIENPNIINEVLIDVKSKIDEKFNVFQKYKTAIENFKKEPEVEKVFSSLERESDIREIFNQLDLNYKNYTQDSINELKLGFIINKSLYNIDECQQTIKNELEEIKNKLFNASNLKNKNLLNLNIEEELQKEEFKKFIVEKINKEGKLNTLFEEKRKNEALINQNKLKIKKEENYLLDTFYCVKCHIKPRNAISKNCHHLMQCEDCILKTKVCPRCGINIDSFEKIFRS